MTTWSDAFSGRSTVTLYLDVTEDTPTSTQIANNQSVARATLRIVGNSASWNNGAGTSSMTINGTTFTNNTWTYDFTVDNTVTLLSSKTVTVTHGTDGSKSISVSATATDNGGAPLGTATITSKTFVLTDFVRLPSAPASPTLTRTSTGTSVHVVSAVASSAVTPSNYDLRWSYDNATWTTVTSIGTDRTADITVNATSTVYVQTRAISTEGTGAWSSSASIAGIPKAPSSISVTRTGHDVAVTAGSSTGSGITSYSVQYSTNGGSTWSTAQTMTSQTYTYTALSPALTYRFRVFSTNAIGDSAFTSTDASTDVFVPAGGKRWDGSAWQTATIARRWDTSGTTNQWVDLTIAKRWTGSAWVDLS